MKQLSSILSVFVATTILVTSVWAQAGGSTSPSTSSTAAAADYSGRPTMEGEVTRINAAKGTMRLKTHEGNLDLHFPPSALQNVKKGDHVSVELSLKPSSSASPGSSTTPAASPNTEKKIDRKY